MKPQDIKYTSSLRKVFASVLSEIEGLGKTIVNEDPLTYKNIPVFFTLSGSSQRYMTIKYLRDAEPGEIITDVATLPTPRGVLVANSFSIEHSEKTNPFVRAEMRELIDGKIEMVSKKLRVVPIAMQMKIKFIFNSTFEALSVFENFAKIPDSKLNFFYYTFGVKVGGSISFADSFDPSTVFEWSFNDSREMVPELTLDVNTSILSPDNLSTRHLNSAMKDIDNIVKLGRRKKKKENDVTGPNSPFFP